MMNDDIREIQRILHEVFRRLRLLAKNPNWKYILSPPNEVYVGGSLARSLLGMEGKQFGPDSDIDIFIWTGGDQLPSMICRDLEHDLHEEIDGHIINVHSPNREEWNMWLEKGEPLIRVPIPEPEEDNSRSTSMYKYSIFKRFPLLRRII